MAKAKSTRPRKTAAPVEPPKPETLLEKLNRTAREATGFVQSTATSIADAAKDKALSIIDGWVEIVPRLGSLGLELQSFGLSMGLNPSLRLELFGSAGAMTVDRIDAILAENSDNSYIKLIFQAVRATALLHGRAGAGVVEPLIVIVVVQLSPEITVYIGKPI